jgi:NDP-sugar pyrophosphorylase family protein
VTEPLQCVILAGGLGTRMESVSGGRPKALLPVAGRPFIDHQLELLARGGVTEVVICTGFGGAPLRSHVSRRAPHGVEVRFVDEGDSLRGTAGALRLALGEGALASSFAVLYGDSYLPIELQPVWDAFRASPLPALMTVLRNDDRWDTSNAIVADGRVVLYDKAARDPRAGERRWIDYGLSVLDAAVIAERIPAGAVADLADLYHDLSVAGELAAYEVEERFYEIGSPRGLEELNRYLGARQSL